MQICGVYRLRQNDTKLKTTKWLESEEFGSILEIYNNMELN